MLMMTFSLQCHPNFIESLILVEEGRQLVCRLYRVPNLLQNTSL